MPVHDADPTNKLGATLPSPGVVINQRYCVLRELGRGGMGFVVQAHDTLLDREVALKILLPHITWSTEAMQRFASEARILARLNSPHVLRVYDYSFVESPESSVGLPFMVLELLHGEDLYTLVARQGLLPVARVVGYVLQVCAGLSAAHAHGIVHRDLKPENMFITVDEDGSECLKLIDFGIARSHNRRVQTRTDSGMGSPGYMAPEQVQDASDVSIQSDIWSVGIVLYELLAHRPVFRGDSPDLLCAQTLLADVAPLGGLRPELPPALIAIVERCLERSPDRRYRSANELAAALACFDDSPPPLEAPAPAQKTSRRRTVAGLAAGLIFAPTLALLPKVAQAPELAGARAWSSRTLHNARRYLRHARAWARTRKDH
jgi:serine/threonine protein kinase